MLLRLKVNQFRHVTPGTKLTFQHGLNVLLGRNASGKTTLLDLVATLLRGNLTTLEEDFDIEFDVEADGCRIEAHAFALSEMHETHDGREQEVSHEGLNAAVYGPAGERVAKVSVQGGAMTTERGNATGSGSVPPKFWSRLFRHIAYAAWPEWRERPVFERQACYRFDESLAMFDAMCGRGDRGPRASLRVTARDAGVASVEGEYLPVQARNAVSETLSQNHWFESIHVDHERLAFLAEAVAQSGFARGTWGAPLRSRDRQGERNVMDYGQFSFGFERPDGTYLTESLLSYGQKRLLAFLYYLHANEGPVVADEVVNGLHHEWIKNLVERMAARQAFLSTQNPLLLDYLTFESPEDVRRTFVFCETEKDTSGIEQMTWRHLSEDDARAFFDAYEVGIQHVSELLRTRGLW
jgi:energy-coupling factor transporter ATP-binding protein EcfA2